MKRLWIAAIVFVAFMACNSSRDVVLSMTSPQDLAVSFSGYYYYETIPGDTIILNGVTPREYVLVLEKEEAINGIVHKDGPNMVDTLHFQLLVDDDELLTQKTTSPSQVIQFSIAAE